LKPSEIRNLVLETLLEYERVKDGGKKPKKRKKAKAKKAKAKVDKPIDIPAFLPKISDEALLRASPAPRRQAFNPFKIAVPLPGVLPEGVQAPSMAQDSAMGGALGWAGSFANQVFAEGLEFLGYPYLAELAQRPEYRVITETIATEMTRKWIKLQAVGEEDKTEKIKAIEDEFTRLGVKDAIRKALEIDGFFGRAHLYLDTGSTDDRDELRLPIGNGQNAMSKAKVGVGSLKRLRVIEPVWTYPSSYNATDPLKPDWYKPSSWFVQGKEVHSTRLLTFIGREVPDLLKPAYSFGGLSMSQMAKPYVDNWLRVRQSVSDLISTFSTSGIKTDLAQMLSAGGEQLFKRLVLFNSNRDNQGLMVLDKDTEEFFNVSTPLGTLDQLQAQAQEHMASVSRIPLVKLLGISPAGLNASSEGEIETFDDTINAGQEALVRPNLTRLLHFVQLSLWGQIDPAITFTFVPLSDLTPKEKAEVQKIEAETDEIRINSSVLDPAEVRKRVANDPDSPYPGIDPDDVPDLLEEEEEGLEPKSGAAGIAKEANGERDQDDDPGAEPDAEPKRKAA
jgi:phage-related protein (TIGR01555 family)